jgi:HD-GYP domain-containing protein (c-di-GMP phosphodiesterase class II)
MSSGWPFSRSLFYPVTVVLVALAVLPVALAGWGFVSSNREQVATLEKQIMSRQSAALAREVELFFHDSVDRIETVTMAIGRGWGEGWGTPLGAARLLGDLIQGNRHIVLLRLLDRAGAGEFVQNRELSASVEGTLTPLLKEAFAANLEGRTVRHNCISTGDGTAVALVSFPVRDVAGRTVGSLQGVVSLDWLASRLLEEGGQGVSVDLVDRSGHVLFSTERQRVGRVAAGHPLVAQFRQAPVRITRAYRDPLAPGEAEVVGSLAPVEGVDWGVVSARDMGVAFAAVHSMARRAAGLALVMGVIATVAGVLLAWRIIQPVRRLAEVSSAMAGGDLARRVSIASRNEIGRLAANFNLMAGEVERTVNSLRVALKENQELLVEAIRALAAAIDAKNPYTRGHSERVSKYAVAIARQLAMPPAEIRNVEIAALLHDVGKIGIEDAILQKPEALTEAEFSAMRAHPLKGAAIVGPIKRLREALPGIRSHHENWDGGGYPDGLKGEAIPLIARVIAAADALDAMTTTRPYQEAMPLEVVLVRLRELAGKKLDPRVVDALFAALRSGELELDVATEVA